MISALEERVEPEPNSGCWLWLGAPMTAGYGEVRDAGRRLGAQRWAWQLARGPIPVGLHVLHRCDNRRCANPDHLFLGTNADNIRDAFRKGRNPTIPPPGAAYGTRNGSARLTDAQAAEIRRHPGETLRFMRAFGVSKATVQRVRRGDTWTRPSSAKPTEPDGGARG